MKKVLSMVLSLLTAASMAVCTSAADTVLTTDTQTRGDWVGKYGSEGYYMLGGSFEEPVQKMPEYANISVSNIMGDPLTTWWAFWDETVTEECPFDPLGALWIDEAKSARRLACQFDESGIDITVDVGDTPKKVSIYLADSDAEISGSTRACSVSLMDTDMNEIEYVEISDFIGGIYVSAEVTGTVVFEILKSGGPNSVYSGIFFDPVDGAAPAPETAAPETAAPETAAPETAAPETVAPETAAPETVAPETTAPETAAPETAESEMTAPQTGDAAVLGMLFLLTSAGAAMIVRKKEI